VEAGEFYLARVDGGAAATLGLQWSDRYVWPDAPDDAGYVHWFAVRRAAAGRGVGLRLLGWAERAAAAAGKRYLRLDCMRDNPALRAYYERAGFAHRGDLAGPTWSAALYEKRVAD
jgi:ribosomal protein S18 acetylase RimI-like enzyme